MKFNHKDIVIRLLEDVIKFSGKQLPKDFNFLFKFLDMNDE